MSSGRAATTTILFTDLVDSTALLERAGDEKAQRIFRAHHRLLSDAVRLHGGQEVKWLGDGLMVAFPSAVAAIRCAISMQQSARRPAEGERLAIRVGLNIGEALTEEQDYFGIAVVLAKRLCDRAAAGQILASDLVARLTRASGEFELETLGEIALKGIATPQLVHQVHYRLDPVRLLQQTPFVGRAAELDGLRDRFSEARSGQGGVVMLVGEPGIGKTRIASEFSELAKIDGARVLWGRCYDGEWAPAFSPFVEAIEQYAAETPAATVREHLADNASIVAQIAPGVRKALPDAPLKPSTEDDGERYRLFEAVRQLFVGIARDAPLTLVLDDLHWADKGSIAMLTSLAEVAASCPLLVLGTYRDVDVDAAHPLTPALAGFRRLPRYSRVVLAGLDTREIGEFLNVITEQDVPGGLVAAIGAETGGNPFFIREVLLHLVEERKIVHEDGRWVSNLTIAEMRVPDSIREVIERRLARVTKSCRQMLSAASAMTGGFSWAVLQAITGENESALLDALDEALVMQILSESGNGLYDFTHALIRHALYEEMSTPRRAALHTRIGQALESLYGDDVRLSELADHFCRAAATADAEKAVDYAERAAARSLATYAYEEAADQYQRALAAASIQAVRDKSQRLRLLLGLGRAQRLSGTPAAARRTYEEACELARDTQSAEDLARAALGLWSVFPEMGVLNTEQVSVLEEALVALGDRETDLGSRVRGALATALFNAPARSRADELSVQALLIARRIANPETLAHALHTRHVVLTAPELANDRLMIATELIGAAGSIGHTELLFQGYIWRIIDLFELGEIAQVDAEIATYTSRIVESRHPVFVWHDAVFAAMRAVFEGRLSEAEPLIMQAMAAGQKVEPQTALQLYGIQMFALRWEQGRLYELEPVFRSVVEQTPGIPSLQCALCFMYSELDREPECREQFEHLASDDFALPHDNGWLVGIALLSGVAAYLGDRHRGERLYDLLKPSAVLNVCAAGGVASIGAASRYLGQLADLLDRRDDAVKHYEQALAQNETMRSRPLVAHVSYDYARSLLRRGGPGDEILAQKLLRRSVSQSSEIGMLLLGKRAQGLLDRIAS